MEGIDLISSDVDDCLELYKELKGAKHKFFSA